MTTAPVRPQVHSTGRARPATAGWPRRALLVPVLLAAAAAGLYLYMGLRNVHDGATGAYDLGIFDQAVSSWAHFHLPVSSLKNSTENLPAHFDLLADHFHPILVLLVPTYWIWPHPATLVVDQALLLAASVLPVHAFARRRLGPVVATGVCTLYATSIGMQSAVNFDFHEVAFAPLLIALTVERADRGKWTAATFSCLLLLFVKEDLGLLLPFVGLLFAVWGQRRLGAALASIGVLSFFVLTEEVMPRLGAGAYEYWTYNSLGSSPVSAARTTLLHPISTLRFATSGGRIYSLLDVFVPFGPLPFFSPVFLLSIPLLAERYLSDRAVMWSNDFHYELTLMPVLALAVADTLGRLTAWHRLTARSRPILAGGALGLMLLGSAQVTYQDGFPLATLGSETALHSPERVRELHVAVSMVPKGNTVAATNNIVPELLGRDPVRLLGPDDPQSQWVVLETDEASFPWGSLPASVTGPYSAESGNLLRQGYVRVLHLVHVDVYERS